MYLHLKWDRRLIFYDEIFQGWVIRWVPTDLTMVKLSDGGVSSVSDGAERFRMVASDGG